MAAAATLVAAVLVVWGLGTRSLWLDEAFSVEIGGGTWSHLWERVSAREANMVLYYAFLQGWVALGRSEAMLRLPSAIAIVAAVPLVHRLGLRLVGGWAAAAGALLFATHPFVVRTGQDARSYGFAILLVVVAAVALVDGPAPRWRVWIAAAVAGAYMHALTLLACAAQLLGAWRRVRVVPVVVAALLAAPIVWFLLLHGDDQIAWLGPPDRGQLAWVAWRMTGEAGWPGVVAYAAAVVAALRGWGPGVGLLAAWLVLPVATTLVASLVKPIFLDRYQLMVVPALVLLAGAGLARLPRAARVAALAGLVALQLVGVVRQARTPSIEDWRGAVGWVKEAQRPGDAVACWIDFSCVAVDYYLARPPAGGPPVVPLARAVDDPAALAALVSAHPRLWLVLSHVQVGQADRRATQARIETALAPTYRLAETREFLGVAVRRYERTSNAAQRKDVRGRAS